MDEQIIPQVQPKVDEPNLIPPDPDSDAGIQRVFDISDDLKISPVTASTDIVPDKHVTENRPVTLPQPVPPIQVAVPSLQEVLKSIEDKPAESVPISPTVPTERTLPVQTNPNLKNIRTYESDVADVMSHRRTSTASIAIAESKKAEDTETIGNSAPTHKVLNLSLTLLSLILVFGGAAGAYYLYSISPLAKSSVPNQNTVSQPQQLASIVPADVQIELPIDSLNPISIVTKIRAEASKAQAVSTIKEIIPVLTHNGQTVRVTGPEMMSLMSVPAPDILIRSLSPQRMLGVYSDVNGQTSTFVIATNVFFQNVFAGMLQWERLMPDDLKMYLYTAPPADIANVTGTISVSTTTNTSTFTLRGQFEDRIIHNKDVREFITDNGNTLFMYSFIDSNKVVVSGNEAALAEILSRLEKQAFIR